MSKKLHPPFKITRGKFYLSTWIIDNFPSEYENMTYVEPYLGGGSVLLNKISSPSKVLNDIDLGIVQIFRALRDEPRNFIGRLKRIKYRLESFERLGKRIDSKDYMDHAVGEFVLRRMSRGGQKQYFAPNDGSAWEHTLNELSMTAKKIENSYIFNKSAIEVIKAFDDEESLCYCDPPDPLEEGGATMTTDEHSALSETLMQHHGKVIISGPSTKL